MSLEPENSTPALVTSHPFQVEPDAPWWSLCRICRLSAAAHTTTAVGLGHEETPIQPEEAP